MPGSLMPLAVVQISVHIQPTECSLERIEDTIVILIQLLKVIMEEFAGLRVVRGSLVALQTRIIPLRMFQDSMVRQVWFGQNGRQWPYNESLWAMAIGHSSMVRLTRLEMRPFLSRDLFGNRFCRSCLALRGKGWQA